MVHQQIKSFDIFIKFFLSGILLISAYCINAQTIERDVIATSGNTSQNGTIQLDWTLGESFVTTYRSTTNTVGEGFHQEGNLSVMTAVNYQTTKQNQLLLFPVPATEYLRTRSVPENVQSYTIYNSAGQLIKQSVWNGINIIDIRALIPGVYVLKMNISPKQYLISKFIKARKP